MEAEFVQPVAVQEAPVFRVRLWMPPVEDGFAWLVDDGELTRGDLDEVLVWAEEHARGNPYELFVRAGSPDFYGLRGRPADDGGAQETVILRTDFSPNE
ncbi:hypothetical protein [Rathayibacter tanaceti]|uniref:Uncharacterized protein n=1 Tax=Rathayibacter tanaceti TaxID=1671680 RepID=A0AAE6RIW2_9MICO|nr:hypothetical protein [Rathayibacter tanaceti]QHC55066.1 hypothetical protein GSU10_05065 [Rathayibacter tanaceti]